RFTIQPGGTVALRYPSLAFDNINEPTLGIIVNLTAVTHLTARSVNDIGQQGAAPRLKRYTITVEARGPLNTGAPLRLGDTGPGNVVGARGLQLTFRADPPDIALTEAGLQQQIVSLLGGQEAIRGLFSRNPNIEQIVRGQVTGILSGSVLPEIFE